MANEKNLIPFNKRTKAETVKIARIGGVASGVTRREKRKTLDIIEQVLSGKEKIGGKMVTREMALALNVILKGIDRGDPRVIETIAKLRGEWVDKSEVDMSGAIPTVLTDIVE